MGVELRLVDCASHHRKATESSKSTLPAGQWVFHDVAIALMSGHFFCLSQTGPLSGTDRVKKGGSYMCHKVKEETLFLCFLCLIRSARSSSLNAAGQMWAHLLWSVESLCCEWEKKNTKFLVSRICFSLANTESRQQLRWHQDFWGEEGKRAVDLPSPQPISCRRAFWVSQHAQ